MYSRRDVQFKLSDVTLRGWLYVPTDLPMQVPGIIMTPGFSALKEHQYEEFAAAFVNAGMCVLLYDHRNFGASDGNPRFEVDPEKQISDLRDAITFLQTQKEVLKTKIGLWGSSFSAGIALSAAAIDERISCVVAQVPYVQGHHQHLKLQHPDSFDSLQKKYAEDQLQIAAGNAPTMMRVVTSDPDKAAIMKQASAYQFFTSIPEWKNQVTLQSIKNAGDYSPIDIVQNIVPPVLFIVADHDTVNSTELALAAFAKITPPKKIIMIKGEHFSPHYELFGICSKEACEWFNNHFKSY